MIKQLQKAIKTYGWKNLSKRAWTLAKRKSGLQGLFFRSISYDNEKIKGQPIAELISWPQLEADEALLEIIKQDQAAKNHVQKAAKEFKKGIYTFYSFHKREVAELDFSFNYLENKQYTAGKHFTRYQQFNPRYGDLKNYWELNRLQYLQILISESLLFPEKKQENKQLLFHHIKTWLDQNRHGRSVAWACGQETSIRCLNMLTYLAHMGLPDKKIVRKKIANLLFLSALHVERYIDYARAQRNNHAILEACYLLQAANVFNKTKEAEAFRQKGEETLMECLEDQFKADGHYIQNSLTYHRFAVQALSWVQGRTQNTELQARILAVLEQSLSFLHHFLVNHDTGAFPNYGPNDGTLLCNYGQVDYRDLRPCLHLLASCTKKPVPFKAPITYLDTLLAGIAASANSVNKQEESQYLKDSGWIILKQNQWGAFCRAADFRPTYPSQNDLLHVDLWHKGYNVLVDTGSKAYFSSEEGTEKFFLLQSSKGHNVVQVNHMDPMEKGPRFTYLDKAYATVSQVDLSKQEFKAKHNSYGERLDTTLVHERHLTMENEGVTITDKIEPPQGYPIDVFWHLGGPIQEIVEEGILFKVNQTTYLISFSTSVKHIVQISEMDLSYYYHHAECLPLLKVVIEDYAPDGKAVEVISRIEVYE